MDWESLLAMLAEMEGADELISAVTTLQSEDTAYRESVTAGHASFEEKIAGLQSEIDGLKAHNYDLLMAAEGAAEVAEVENVDNALEGEASIGVDDLFEEEKDDA